MRNKPGPKLGYKFSADARLHMSQARLGKKLSVETRKKISLAKKGVQLSKEHIENMSKSLKGKPRPNREQRIATLRSADVIEKRIQHMPKGDKHPRWKGGRSSNKKYILWYNRQRKRNKKAAGEHTWGEWETLKAQYNWTCPSCGKSEPEIKLTEDHIIPLSKGGSNRIENIQPLCGPCNRRKHTKIIKYSPTGKIIPLEEN